MKLYSERIGSEGIEALQQLASSEIQHLYSSSSNWRINSHYFLVPEVSIRLGAKCFLVINNDWADTPEEYISYYKLGVSIKDRPQEIEVEPYKDCWSYHFDHMTFSLGPKRGVESVSVFEDQYSETVESVKYDSAIRIILSNEDQILISPDQSISGLLIVTTNLRKIETDTSKLNLRWTSSKDKNC